MNINELDAYNLADAVKFNSELNPAIWSGQEMKPEVRAKLLAIADDFREFLGLSNLEVKDITVSGSNAAYTYTPHSDIDLHLVVDIPQADADEVYRELFDAKKYQYNDLHNITIGGYDVELYVENANQPPTSQGIYSIKNNDWVKIPRQVRATVDDQAVKSKFEDIGHRIESAVKSKDFDKLNTLATKVKNFRQAGLDAHGELGPENLAYKMLRSQDLIKQLYDARTAAQDAEFSLNERKKKKKKQRPVRYGYTFNVVNDSGSTDAGADVAMETANANPSDEEILKDFIDFCSKELKLKALPIVKLRKDPQWSVVHKTFGRYIDDKNLLEVAWGQRHIMDVLRTVAHELTHRRQHEREDVPSSAGETGSPYENEANARAGVLMRDYARLHPNYFEAGQAEELHGDEVKENWGGNPKLSDWHNTLRSPTNEYSIMGHRVKFTPQGIFVYKGAELVYTKNGNYSAPTNSNVKSANKIVATLIANEKRKQLATNKDVSENYADYFRTTAPTSAVKPTQGTMNIEGYRVDYNAKNKSIIISRSGQVVHKEGGTSTGQGRPLTIEAIAARARRIINQLDTEVDESLKGKLGALATAACVAGAPGCATTADTVRGAQTIARTAQSAGNLTRAGVRAELDQELKNYIQAQGQGPGSANAKNQSRLYQLQRKVQQNESSGYIPTRKQEKDPRFLMALSPDVRPGATGKEANKMALDTDSQGHPNLLIKGLKNALREFKETGRFDRLGNQVPPGPEFKPTMPKGTLRVDVSDVYDWYKLGNHIANMKGLGQHDFGQGPPSTIISFGDEDTEHKFIGDLEATGLGVTDIDPKDPKKRPGKKIKTDPTYNVDEAEQLDEVKMSPGALRKFAASPEAEGIMAGFEAELIFRDTQHDDDDGEMEADMDYDERTSSIDDVIDFFSNDDHGYGMSDRQADRLRERLDEAYFEWRDDQIMRDFEREADDLVRDVWLEERPMVERIHSALTDGMGLDDEQADAVQRLHDQRRNKEITGSDMSEEQLEMTSQYSEAKEIADSILDEEVEASLENQDGYYDQALDEFRDNYDADDSGFFSDMGWRWMSDIMNEFNLDWPYYSGGGGSYGTRSWDEIAGDIERVTGMPVKVGYGYHSAPRKPNEYVLEPDSSLNPDDSEDYGLELVSPPMPLNKAIEQLNAIVDWANSDGNAYTNSSTGLHMGVSIPYKGGDVDYLKLITFLGDQYVLEKFGRAANTYCDSAFKKLKQNVAGSKNRGDDKIMSAMELMKSNLIELAHRYVQQGVGNSKYTSAHIKPGYIEFRSPGGDYLAKGDEEIGALEDTMRRFAYAMYLAGRPDLERKEYYKKLYKLIAPEGNKDLEMFAKFSSGEITAEELKKQWAEKVIAKEVPITGKEKGNWVLYNNATQKPVQGGTFGNYSEIDAWERAKAKYSTPAESMEEFKKAYTLADSSANNGRWDIVERDTDRVIDVIDAPTRGQASDEANDRQYEESWFIRPHVEFAAQPKPEPKLSRRAQLAKQIAQPADYVIVNKHSGLPFYTFRASSQSQAVDFGVTYLRDKGLDLDNFSVQKASNVKQAIDNRVDSKQLQQRVQDSGTGRYEIVDRRTGEVVLRYRAADADDAGTGFNNWLSNQGLPIDTENYGYRPEQTVAPSTNPNPTVQNPQQVRMPSGIPVWELFDVDTGSVLNAFADHNAAEAKRQAMSWLRSIGAENPSTYEERFAIRPRMLQPGERNLSENFETDAEKAMRALNMAAKKLGYPNYSAVPEGQKNTCRQMAVYSLNTNNASHPNFLNKKVKNEG